MDETDQVTQMLLTTPPTCVTGFRLTSTDLPIKWDDNVRSVWRLECHCGGQQGRILGYPLRDFNPDGGNSFISPIGFECGACGKVNEILDTDKHGYHPEVAKREGGTGSAIFRGNGPRTAWQCPQCKSAFFALTVAFIYWDAVFDLAEDDPDWPIQEFFCVFLSFANCGGCGHLSEPTNFGKL